VYTRSVGLRVGFGHGVEGGKGRKRFCGGNDGTITEPVVVRIGNGSWGTKKGHANGPTGCTYKKRREKRKRRTSDPAKKLLWVGGAKQATF